jgi:hypothetical protein
MLEGPPGLPSRRHFECKYAVETCKGEKVLAVLTIG